MSITISLKKNLQHLIIILCISLHGASVIKPMSSGPDVNPTQELFDTVRNTHISVADCINNIRSLIGRGADITFRDHDGMTLLHHAAINGNADIVDYVYNLRPCSINETNRDKLTPLMLATYYGHLSAVTKLIKLGAKLTLLDSNNNSLLHFAANSGNIDLVDLICNLRDLQTGLPLFNINTRSNDGMTPLIWAVQEAHIRLVTRLIELHSTDELLSTDRDKNSLLHHAVLSGSVDMVNLVYNLYDPRTHVRLFDINVRNNNGQTPLFIAVLYGYTTVLDRLIELGATISLTIRNGLTLLHTAVESKNIEIINRVLNLLDHTTRVPFFGIDVRSHPSRTTPLMWAALKGARKTIARLIELGATTTLTDINGSTLLHYAALNQDASMVDFVYSLQDPQTGIRLLDLNARDNENVTPLMSAAWHKRCNTLRRLISLGADPTLVSRRGDTALHYALNQEMIDNAHELVQAGSVIDIANNNHESALTLACTYDAHHAYSDNHTSLEARLHRLRSEYLHDRRASMGLFVIIRSLSDAANRRSNCVLPDTLIELIRSYVSQGQRPTVISMIINNPIDSISRSQVRHGARIDERLIGSTRHIVPITISRTSSAAAATVTESVSFAGSCFHVIGHHRAVTTDLAHRGHTPLQLAQAYDAAHAGNLMHYPYEAYLHEERAQYLESRDMMRLAHLWQSRPLFSHFMARTS